MDRDDVRMVERGDGARLARETGKAFGVLRDVVRKDLQGHVAGQARIVGAIHRAHATSAECAADLVHAESRTGHEGHGERLSLVQAAHPRKEVASYAARVSLRGRYE